MQHYSVLDQVSADKRPRRHHGEGLTCSWGALRISPRRRPESSYQDLNTLLTF